jgi:hypothetical protein
VDRTWTILWLAGMVPIGWGWDLPFVARAALMPLPGLLVLWLVVTSMRSLRSEWERRDLGTDVTGAPLVG